VTLNKGLRREGLRHCEAVSKISRDTTTEVFRILCVCRILVAAQLTVGLLARVPSKCQKIKRALISVDRGCGSLSEVLYGGCLRIGHCRECWGVSKV
jgi:hypothetical protein